MMKKVLKLVHLRPDLSHTVNGMLLWSSVLVFLRGLLMAVLELVPVPLGCGATKGKKWKFESKKYDLECQSTFSKGRSSEIGADAGSA